MKNRLELGILPQPDDTTCGPTCLHAVYRYFGDAIELSRVIAETRRLAHGGTYSVFLGLHALSRGYRARLFTFNLQVFDPTWFDKDRAYMIQRLKARRAAKRGTSLAGAIDAYLDFIEAGGEVEQQDLTARLIRTFLRRGVPILTGLSATYLYQSMREIDETNADDDVRGDPSGHFVVLCGYDPDDRTVLVADPMESSPSVRGVGGGLQYVVEIDHLVCSILLGILTHDADLLIIEPDSAEARDRGRPDTSLLFDLPLPTDPPSPIHRPPPAQ